MHPPPEPRHPADPPRLGVFVSGTGRTLRNLHARTRDGSLNADICLVLASAPCPAAEWAQQQAIPTVIHSGDLTPDHAARLADEHRLHAVALAGYLRLLPIPPALTNRVVNIHPALLPAFGGKGMYGPRVHRAVIDAGCKVSGCTVHLCDDRYDTGPILAQAACPVLDDDTPHTLAARVFELELRLYPAALQDLLAGRFAIQRGRARLVRPSTLDPSPPGPDNRP